MEPTIILITMAIGCGIVNVTLSIMIAYQLEKRGININFLLLRIFILKYLGQYREVTRKETGKTGLLFPAWIISINLAFVFVILGLIL